MALHPYESRRKRIGNVIGGALIVIGVLFVMALNEYGVSQGDWNKTIASVALFAIAMLLGAGGLWAYIRGAPRP